MNQKLINTHFLTVEVIDAIENLVSTEKNLQAFLSCSFLHGIEQITSHGGTKEKLAVCKLLWSLALLSAEFKSHFIGSASNILSGIYSNQNIDHELLVLGKCIDVCILGFSKCSEGQFSLVIIRIPMPNYFFVLFLCRFAVAVYQGLLQIQKVYCLH